MTRGTTSCCSPLHPDAARPGQPQLLVHVESCKGKRIKLCTLMLLVFGEGILGKWGSKKQLCPPLLALQNPWPSYKVLPFLPLDGFCLLGERSAMGSPQPSQCPHPTGTPFSPALGTEISVSAAPGDSQSCWGLPWGLDGPRLQIAQSRSRCLHALPADLLCFRNAFSFWNRAFDNDQRKRETFVQGFLCLLSKAECVWRIMERIRSRFA